MNNHKLIPLAMSTVFKKIPMDLMLDLLNNKVVLEVMNRYTQERYNEDFWLGDLNFNPNFRLVCPPTSFDFISSWPFVMKTVFLEYKPFTKGENYAKFGINWRLDKPLLVG
jgi:hypothetical protein